jgi:O-antigen/teichoic acid export membrane protein
VTDSPSSLRHRTVSNMAWVAVGNGAIAVLKIVVLVFLTRLLSPADFGLVGAALVVITFSVNFSQLGLGPALVQRPSLEPRHISTAFVASTALGLLVGLTIWSAAPLIAQFFRMDNLTPVVRWLSLVFPITGLSATPDGLLQRELRFRVLAHRDVLAYGVGYGAVGIGLAALGWGVWALVAAQLAQVTIRTAILLRAAPPLLCSRPTWASFKELMEYGVGQSIGRMGIILANQADNLVVGRWLGAVALGLYSRAYQLMSVPTGLLGDVLDKVLFPTMARVQDEPRRLASAYLQGVACVGLMTLPLGVVVAVLAPELVAVIFGSRWEALVPAFQVLMLGMMFRMSSRMGESLARATGKVYRRAWRQWLYAGLVFMAAWIGQRWGVTGVAFGVLGALFMNYLLMAQLSLSVGGISWARFIQVQLPALGLATVLGGVTIVTATATRHLGLPPIASLVTGSLAAAGTGLTAVWVAPSLALGEQGVRMGQTLRSYLLGRLRPARLRGSA